MVNERAKQFLPFQSLKGLEAELRKREKVKIKRKNNHWINKKNFLISSIIFIKEC